MKKHISFEQVKGVDAVDLGVTQIVEKEGCFLAAATFPEKVPVDTIVEMLKALRIPGRSQLVSFMAVKLASLKVPRE